MPAGKHKGEEQEHDSVGNLVVRLRRTDADGRRDGFTRVRWEDFLSKDDTWEPDERVPHFNAERTSYEEDFCALQLTYNASAARKAAAVFMEQHLPWGTGPRPVTLEVVYGDGKVASYRTLGVVVQRPEKTKKVATKEDVPKRVSRSGRRIAGGNMSEDALASRFKRRPLPTPTSSGTESIGALQTESKVDPAKIGKAKRRITSVVRAETAEGGGRRKKKKQGEASEVDNDGGEQEEASNQKSKKSKKSKKKRKEKKRSKKEKKAKKKKKKAANGGEEGRCGRG